MQANELEDATANATTIAQLLDGLTPRRVRQLADAGIIPRPSRGKYLIAGSVRGYVRYVKKGESTGIAEYEAALKRAKAELAQLELDRARGRVLDADVVEVRWTRMITNARAKALGLIQRLPPAVRSTDFSHKSIVAVVKELVYEFLRELASYDGERPPIKPPNLSQAGEIRRI